MILSSTPALTNIVNWTTIAANVATILGIFGLTITVLVFFKNKVSKNTIQVKMTIHRSSIHGTSPINKIKRIYLELDLYNFTDKQFFITDIEFTFNTQNLFLLQSYRPFPEINIYYKRKIKNVSVIPHEAMTIEGFIEIPCNVEIPCQVNIRIGTTEKELNFLVPVFKAEDFVE